VIITSQDDLEDLVEAYMEMPAFAFDVETVGVNPLDPRRNTVVWVSLATYGRSDVIPCGHPNGRLIRIEPGRTPTGKVSKDMSKATRIFAAPPPQLERHEVFSTLKPLFFSDKAKVGHNIKFDLCSTWKYFGDLPPGPYIDTGNAAYLLDSSRKGQYKLGMLVKRELGFVYDKSVGKDIAAQPFKETAKYSRLDALYTWLLWTQVYEPKIPVVQRVWDVEAELIGVLCEMEQEGAPLDEDALSPLFDELTEELDELRGKVYKAAGKVFDLGSTQQLGKILYEERRLKPRKMTKGGKDGLNPKPSCDAEALEYYRNRDPLVGAYLEYGDVDKLLNTYVAPYVGTHLVNGKIHASFNAMGAETGRFCVDPETLVEMPRDLSRFPDGVPLKDIKVGDLVYSFTWDKRLVLRPVKWVGPTKVAATKVITVQDKDGKVTTLRLSADHLVRKYRGEWQPAGALKPDDRLMGMLPRRYNESGHAFFPPSKKRALPGKETGGKVYEHRWVYEAWTGHRPSTKAVVHHVDHNKVNNHWSNLQAMAIGEHVSHHRQHARLEATNHTVLTVEDGPVMQLWDIEVEDTHTFIGSDVALHNSSSNPNLQNVPRPGTEKGKKIRGLFWAPDDDLLVVADYSQVEPRIYAGLSRDPAMMSAYLEEGGDFYTLIAEPFGLPRDAGKKMFLSVAYGIGPDKLAVDTGIKATRAKQILDDFDRQFPVAGEYKRRVIRDCRKRKPPYVETLLGRRRYLPTIFAQDYGVKMRAERQAFNTVIQGGAADVNKLAMIETHKVLADLDPRCKMILTVHDEIVTRVPRDIADEAAQAVKTAMEAVGTTVGLPVPLVADVKIVKRWSEAKS
jgi:DNA polymerase I-like protein with 3'-5' exonuclease and polymerase domains